VRALAVTLLCGCGRIGFGVHDAGGAGGDDDANGDAIIDLDAASGACGAERAAARRFTNSIVEPIWTTLTGNGLTVAQTGGVLQITFANNVPASQTAG
jgi:hypothetical protein